MVDDVATLTAYQTDRQLRDRIAQSLGLLLTQGRAVGVCVVAALQDPRQEVLAFRILFPPRSACGWMSRRRWTWCAVTAPARRAPAVTASTGARQASATCASTASESADPGQAGYVTDSDIAAMAAEYAPRRVLDGAALFVAAEGDVAGEVVELPIAREDDEPDSTDDDERQAS